MNKCSYTSIPPPLHIYPWCVQGLQPHFSSTGSTFLEQIIVLDKQINISACNGASIEYYSTGSTCFIMGNEALFSWQQLLCLQSSGICHAVWRLGAQLAKSTVSHLTGPLPKFLISVAYCTKIMLSQWWTNPKCQVTMVTQFCTTAPNICGSSIWKLLSPYWHIEFWGEDFSKKCASLCYVVYKNFVKVRMWEDILQTHIGNQGLQFAIMSLDANVRTCYSIFIMFIFLIRTVQAKHLITALKLIQNINLCVMTKVTCEF